VGFRRNSNGSLTELNIDPPFPSSPKGSYCGVGQAAGLANNLAFAFQLYVGYLESSGPIQLASYSANSSGELSTTSKSSNMPKVLVGNLDVMNMSPSGKLLAVGGSDGLQVFHFNGPSPITHFTGLLTTQEVDEIHWDNSNHLYAVGYAASKLWVFTVTPTGYVQAPGSPYTIHNPFDVVVLPLPL
jgi:WD40 repeat protein